MQGSSYGQSNFNANITGQGNYNANIEGPKFDANRSVFETRKADNIRIDDSPPHFGVTADTNIHNTSFNVNTPNINVNTPTINTHANYNSSNININTPTINTHANYEVNHRNDYERDNNFSVNANYG